MNLPNLLSLSRIAVMPFIVMALYRDQNALLLALLLAGASTDVLDGLLARRLNQVTDLGKILDPLTDKIGIDALAVCLWLWRGFPWWAAAAIIGRDLLILAGGLFIMRRRRVVPVSNMTGKVAVNFLAAAIICYAMRWQPWGYWILLGGMALVAASGMQYLKIYMASPKPSPNGQT